MLTASVPLEKTQWSPCGCRWVRISEFPPVFRLEDWCQQHAVALALNLAQFCQDHHFRVVRPCRVCKKRASRPFYHFGAGPPISSSGGPEYP
jgi:hypothetical protein